MEALAEDSSIYKRAKNLLKDSKSSPDNSEEKLVKREDSYKLLWDELEGLKEAASTTREPLYKTLQGVAVLRARLVLATLLSNWPQEGRRLSTTFLGCSDIIHYFCLLDLLLQQQTLEEKEKVREGREGGEGWRKGVLWWRKGEGADWKGCRIRGSKEGNVLSPTAAEDSAY